MSIMRDVNIPERERKKIIKAFDEWYENKFSGVKPFLEEISHQLTVVISELECIRADLETVNKNEMRKFVLNIIRGEIDGASGRDK